MEAIAGPLALIGYGLAAVATLVTLVTVLRIG